MIPTGIFSVATAVPAAEPEPLAILVELGSATRRILRLWIVEATLFSVTTEGREMIFMFPSLSAALSSAFRFLKNPAFACMIDRKGKPPTKGSPAGKLLEIVCLL